MVILCIPKDEKAVTVAATAVVFDTVATAAAAAVDSAGFFQFRHTSFN